MFELSREIARWKSALRATRHCSQDELDELESHLRDDIASLLETGVSPQQAFVRCMERLGDVGAVSGEFAKNDRPLRLDSFALGAGGAIAAIAGIVSFILGISVWSNGSDGLLAAHVGLLTFAYCLAFVLGMTGAYAILRASFAKRSSEAFRNQFAAHCRLLLGLVVWGSMLGVLLGGLWSHRNWGQFWSGSLRESAALSIVVVSLALYARLHTSRIRGISAPRDCVLLSLATWVAWFAPVVGSGPVGSPFLAAFYGVILLHVAAAGLSFVASSQTLAAA